MNFINLTPHVVRIRLDASTEAAFVEGDIEVAPTAPAARIDQVRSQIATIDGIPVFRSEMGELQNLPNPQDGVIYIVSMPACQVANQRLDRGDVVSPDSSPQGGGVRYGDGPNKGQPYAVRGFQQF